MAFFKKIVEVFLIGCLFFVVPALVAILLFGKAVHLLLPVAHKLNEVFDLQSVFGTATVTIVCLLLIVVLCAFFGLLLKRGFIKVWSNKLEERLFFFLPSFQMMKYRFIDDEKYRQQKFWKAILLKEEDFYRVALVTDDSSDTFLTVYIPDAPKMDAGEIRYILRDECEFYDITMKEAMNALHSFGKGIDFERILEKKIKE